ncbi:hypothetical protein [Streptomyces sp. NPDC046862]|uniref:hypothetical protein n=1 Tax=Streptomyces sp. NPDC046862 TaxID=3154603 RepID=UPI003451513C
MGGLVETITGLLDRRQLTSTYAPVLGFLTAVGAVIASGAGWSPALRAWRALDPAAKLLVPLVVLGAVVLLGRLVEARRLGLVRLLEGYWDRLPGGCSLAARCRRRHKELRDAAGEQDLRRREYPSADRHLMPTTLGNVLRGAEMHSLYRYDLDGVSAWPRLYPTLPDSFTQLFVAAAAGLETMVTVSGLGVAFVVVGGTLAVFLLPWYGAAVCVLGGGAAAWAGYRGAIGAAQAYGQLYRAAFDVHRWTLLDTMGLTRPTGYAQERRQWRALTRLWVLGAIDTDSVGELGYTAPAAGAHTPAPMPALPVPAPAPNTVVPLRLGPRLAALLLALTVVASVLAVLRPGGEPPCRARATLTAYHQLTGNDVRGPNCTMLLGRYLLRPVQAHKAVASDALGPRLPPAALAGGEVVLTVKPASAPPPAVRRGATVSALVVPSRGATRVVEGLTVLDVLDRGRGVVLAGTLATLRDVMSARPKGEVHLLLAPG